MAIPELTTAAAIRAQLGLSSTYDTILGYMLTGIEEAMRLRYGRPDGWTQAVFTEKFDGELYDSVTVRNTPVDTTYVSQSLSVDSVAVSSDLYTVDPNTGRFGFTYSFTSQWTNGLSIPRLIPRLLMTPNPNMGYGFRNVTVVYKGGYTSIPTNLTQAATLLVGYLFNTRNKAGFESENLGHYSYKLGDLFNNGGPWQQADSLVYGLTRSAFV